MSSMSDSSCSKRCLGESLRFSRTSEGSSAWLRSLTSVLLGFIENLFENRDRFEIARATHGLFGIN